MCLYSGQVGGLYVVMFVLQIAEHFFGILFFSGVGNHRYLDFDGFVAEANLDNVADLHISGCLGNLVVYHNTSGSQASFAMVLLLISRETFKYLSNLICISPFVF